MSKFKLSDLGNKLQVFLVSWLPTLQEIEWNLDNYDLKTDAIHGELKIIHDPSETAPFSSMQLILALADMGIYAEEYRKTHKKNAEGDGFGYTHTLKTSVSLQEFPGIALTNFIADKKEVLNYEWNISNGTDACCQNSENAQASVGPN